MPRPEARQLTHAHRRAQVHIGLGTIALMSAAWPVLDPNDISGSARSWLAVTQPIVQTQRDRSAHLAAAYLRTFRDLELGPDPSAPDPILAGAAPIGQITTSLLVTGVYALRSSLARGVDLARASDLAKAGSAAAAMRLTLNAGRETILDTVRADRRSGRWERVTSGNACDFCSMLEGRGAVYSEDTADFEAHDHCSCTAEPAYDQ